MAFFSFRIPLGSRGRCTSITIHQHIRSGSSCSGCAGCGCFVILAVCAWIWFVGSQRQTTPQSTQPESPKTSPIPNAQSNTIASLPPHVQKFVEDVRKAPSPEEVEKMLVINKAREYASPKLKDPNSFSVTEVLHYTHDSGDFHLVRFTADGRNLRVGVTIADDGTISIIDKDKMPSLLKVSKQNPR